MITMRIKGGLGNQLFQYAAAYALSKRLKQPIQFNPAFTNNMTPRGFRLDLLNISDQNVVSDTQLPMWIRFRKSKYLNKISRVLKVSKCKVGDTMYWLETRDAWQPDFFVIDNKNLYVDGYFQSERYFKKYRQELLEQITPKYKAEEEYEAKLEEIKKNNSVAVHVRRSDFKNDNNQFHYLLDENYYKNAISYMRDKLDNPIFYWFSDDMAWVNSAIGKEEDFQFVSIKTSHGDVDDMMLMKNCKHIITANSTFSWWAAWLNESENSIKIVPKKPYGMEGMIPEDWIKI